MTSLSLNREEFAAKRRADQDNLVERLQSVIGAHFSTGDISPLHAALSNMYAEVYAAEADNEGLTPKIKLASFLKAVDKMLSHATEESSVHTTALALANALLNAATADAHKANGGTEMEWVSMNDQDVRHTHEVADGQRRPFGEKFKVGESEMSAPGDLTAPINEWINCRCSLRPVKSATTAALTLALTAALTTMRAEGSLEVGEELFADAIERGIAVKVGLRDDGATLYDLNPAWEDVDSLTQGDDMTEAAQTEADPTEEDAPTEEAPADEAPTPVDDRIPWHGQLAPEGVKSGDGRMFTNLGRTRDLPLPLTWQEISADGHDQNITVAMIEKIEMIDGIMEASGHFLSSVEESDEVIGLIAEFGSFGVSVDADDIGSAAFDEESGTETYDDPRICSACIVSIPAFATGAKVMLGPHPILDADQANGDVPDKPVEEEAVAAAGLPLLQMAGVPESFKQAALAKAEAERQFAEDWNDIITAKDLAPGVTEDGPGWLTHPVDTDRLRDYWVHGAGAAEIGWGIPGDFNRCRVNVAEYVKPQYLNGYCANRHYDALHVWPGQELTARENLSLSSTEAAPALTLVASAAGSPGWFAPSEFFAEPVECDPDDGVVITEPNEDGLMRTYGYVAEWGVCHIGYDGMCKEAPPSPSNYSFFRTGQVNTPDGPIKTGRLTADTGHANPRLAAMPAAAHYDNTGSAWAFVASGENDRGIWFSGLVKPGTPDELLNDIVAAGRISGDWRPFGADLELVAALTVNVPGFPIVPTEAAVTVENGLVKQLSLVAAGVPPRKVEEAATITMTTMEPEAMSMIASLVVDEMESRKARRARLDALKVKVDN